MHVWRESNTILQWCWIILYNFVHCLCSVQEYWNSSKCLSLSACAREQLNIYLGRKVVSPRIYTYEMLSVCFPKQNTNLHSQQDTRIQLLHIFVSTWYCPTPNLEVALLRFLQIFLQSDCTPDGYTMVGGHVFFEHVLHARLQE